jgi:putative sigma-54 modulation protein
VTYEIHGGKIKITKAIREYIINKLNKIEKHFSEEQAVKIKVFIKIKNYEQIIEVTIPLTKAIIRAEERHQDLYAAIDLVTDKLERQIIKYKTKTQTKTLKNNKETTDYNLSPETTKSKIVKRKKFTMKPMTEEEAILQMHLLGHNFFIFRDSETNQICVLYQRKDGYYGVIET